MGKEDYASEESVKSVRTSVWFSSTEWVFIINHDGACCAWRAKAGNGIAGHDYTTKLLWRCQGERTALCDGEASSIDEASIRIQAQLYVPNDMHYFIQLRTMPSNRPCMVL